MEEEADETAHVQEGLIVFHGHSEGGLILEKKTPKLNDLIRQVGGVGSVAHNRLQVKLPLGN